jgi:DNA-binding NarL/FixJ family response regulator
MEKLRIFIADDHPIMRGGLKFILHTEGDFEVAGEASDGEKALNMLIQNSFDAAILDVEMPKLSGLEAARKLMEEKIPIKIIFLTMYKDEDMFNEAMDIGAMGYVLKESAAEDIVECIHAVAAGKYYISPLISSFLMNRQLQLQNLSVSTPSINDLTKSERLILSMIAAEKTTKQISEELHISHKTVENHRSNISKKLNLQGAHSLIKFALSNKNIL